MIVQVRGSGLSALAPTIREIGLSVDPLLRVETIRSLADANLRQQMIARQVSLMLTLVLASVFLLSAAGIYALMSFTVTQRRREIGLRSALGARPLQVLRSVFTRAAGQVGIGMGLGLVFAFGIHLLSGGQAVGGRAAMLMLPVSLAMALIAFRAAVGPARRGLSIPPTEALRSEA